MIGCEDAKRLFSEASARGDVQARRRVLDDHCPQCPACVSLLRSRKAALARGVVPSESIRGDEPLDRWVLIALVVACALLTIGLRNWLAP